MSIITAKPEGILTLAAQMKPLPAILVRLAKLTEAHRCDLGEVAEAIRVDPVLTLKLLRVANSAFSATSMPVSTVDEAVMRLGTALVVSLAFTLSVGDLLAPELPQYGLPAGQLWTHSVATAIAAESLVRIGHQRIPPAAVTAALLHDIGKQILAMGAGDQDFAYVHEAEGSGETLFEAEREILEMDHAEVGCIVAQHWQLPDRICRAIMYHHDPSQWDDPICDAVYLANLVAKAMESIENGLEPESVTLQPGVLERLELPPFDFKKFSLQCAERFGRLRALYSA